MTGGVCCWSRRRSRSAISCCCGARGRAARHRAGGRGGRGGGRIAGDRRTGDVPPSAGALGDVPVGGGRGSPRGPLGVGRGNRSRGRPGPSCMASGDGRRGTRRAGRPRARALGWPGAGARRARCRSGLPGLSNPGNRCAAFLSPRTVEWHLRNVFTKLGIRSRRELATIAADSQLIPADARRRRKLRRRAARRTFRA